MAFSLGATMSIAESLKALITWLFKMLSGEFILDHCPNGGGVIILRTLICSLVLFLAATGVHEFLDPKAVLRFDADDLGKAAHKNFEWFGAIFVAVYVALYSRFSSQWSYLAGVYNQICQSRAESGATQVPAQGPLFATGLCQGLTVQDERYASWMAGFIADAFEMHLDRKGIFSGCIESMLLVPGVRDAFLQAADENRAELEQFEAWRTRKSQTKNRRIGLGDRRVSQK